MVKPKKHLGQHFLTDKRIAERIVDSLSETNKRILEIGPGTGVLTDFLISKKYDFIALDVDAESIDFLHAKYPGKEEQIILSDFLKTDIKELIEGNYSVIGNFPYNISSQIFFKILEQRNCVDEVVCMLQKEVAERIASKEGSKVYGILSVLLQTFFNIEYLFTVKPGAFNPPPAVNSGVIRLKRNERDKLPIPEDFFFKMIKEAFNKRRKVLSNSLKPILLNLNFESSFLKMRPEQLSVDDFIKLGVEIIKAGKS